MRLSETMLAAQVCAYFWACYRTIWTDRSFFGDLETDKFTSMELGKLISKSSRLSHLRQLKSIYSGKNISYCREK